MTLLVLTALVDVAAVGALLWVLGRGGRQSAAEQQKALGRLRAELAALVADAEARTRALDATLAAREATLRVLLAATQGVMPEGAPPEGGGRRSTAPAPDPAQIRLVRDLEVVLGGSSEGAPVQP